MSIRVTLSANAGTAIEIGTSRIWVDALHDTSVPGFSTLQEQQLRQLWSSDAFQNPDAVVYTHCHPDHYSAELTEKAHLQWPEAQLFLPEKQFPRQELLCGDTLTRIVGDVELRFFRLTHECKMYQKIPHYGLIIACGDESILVPGDCAVATSELVSYVKERHFSLVLLNFPWVTLRKGRNFIKENLNTDHIAIYHIPFKEDDLQHFRPAIWMSIQQMSHDYRIYALDSFLQTLMLP